MKDKNLANIIAAGILSLTSTGCPLQYMQWSYSQKIEHTHSQIIDKRGGKIMYGGDSNVGEHRMGIAVHYGELAGETSTGQIEFGSFVDEKVKSITPSKDSIDFSTSLERRFCKIGSSNSIDLDNWISLKCFIGLGVNFNIITASTEQHIGESTPINTPEFKLDSVRGFADGIVELKVGKAPYAIFPLQIGMRAYHNMDDFPENMTLMGGVGYQIEWGTEGKDESICDYMPERKVIPLGFELEVDREEKEGVCTSEYHQSGEGKRHLVLELYSCSGDGCARTFRSLVKRGTQGEYTRIPASPECFATETDLGDSKVRDLYCKMPEGVYHEEVTFTTGDNRDLQDIPNNVARQMMR